MNHTSIRAVAAMSLLLAGAGTAWPRPERTRNGTFEQGAAEWTGAVVDGAENHTQGGSKSLRLDHKGDVWQAIGRVVPGRRYRLRCHVKAKALQADPGSADNQVFVRWTGSFGTRDSLTHAARPLSPGTYDWQFVQRVYTAPDGAAHASLIVAEERDGELLCTEWNGVPVDPQDGPVRDR